MIELVEEVVNMQKYLHRKAFVFLFIASITLFLGGCNVHQKSEEIRFAEQLKAGWNLGNSFDAHSVVTPTDNPTDYETYWKNPVTTPEMIQDIRQAGFQTIRIPVTWQDHVDDNFVIDQKWLNRVTEVVDMSLDADFYVILNAHHDDWYTPDEAHLPLAIEKMKTLWTQIGTHFAKYDEHLLFESMNEPRLIGTGDEWATGPYESQQIVNQLNAVFVETIRQLEGNNAERYLLLPTYAARFETAALEAFELPQGKHLMVSIHPYAPAYFTQDDQEGTTFNPENSEDTSALETFFSDVDRLFIQKGIPVVLTEFAASDKNNLDARMAWTKYIVDKSRALTIPYIWWDPGGDNPDQPTFSLYNRYKRQWLFPKLVDILVK